MGMRTRTALTAIPEMAGAPVGQHRSKQLHGHDLVDVDLVVVMEADHVRYIRRHHPSAAPRTATLRRLVADLPASPPSLEARVAALGLADVVLHHDEDVEDPAGRDEQVYAACAEELWALCRRLAPLLNGGPVAPR
jgi:protein-tyrosine-phosphatase